MNQESLKRLAGISNIDELRRAVEVLFLPFGSTKDIRLLQNPNRDEYLCIVELDSPQMNAPAIAELGGIYFGNSVALRIPLKQ